MKKILYFILGLIIILIVAYFVIMNLPQASVNNKTTDLSIQATELFSAYSNNENKANKLYNGKVIEVTGKLIDISEDEQGAYVLILNSGNDFGGILCTLHKNPKSLPKVGEDITIKGQCNGLLMDVVLSKCVIVTN